MQIADQARTEYREIEDKLSDIKHQIEFVIFIFSIKLFFYFYFFLES